MIDPKSLRIGNTFLSPDGTPSIVTRLDASIHANKWFYNPAECNGIPLSATLLEKAGFTKDGFNCWNYDVYRKFGHFKTLRFSGDYLYLTEGKEDDKRRDDDLIVIWNKDIMKELYLHQLQNLVFVISGGRELDIKL